MESHLPHGPEHHDKMSNDAQMKKLHAMMPMFSQACAGLETALEKGYAPAASVHAKKILAAVPDFKKSKPHKNINQKKKFVVIAIGLENAVNLTTYLAHEGDFPGPRIHSRR